MQNTKKIKILEEITERIGSLGTPSKMPGHSWSISATMCITGSKLSKLPNTPCSKCYARKGRYIMQNVKNAQTKRLEAWEQNPDWVNLMSIRLLLLKEPFFRWFDSGDLQSTKMLEDINQVAKNTELTTKHWLPTQERKIVAALENKADNLTIRISSPAINIALKENNNPSSFITIKYIEESDCYYQCPSSKQNNQCGSCRACWNAENKIIAYLKH